MSEAAERFYLDVELRPNPTASPGFLAAILFVVTAVNVGFAAVLLSRGAWPVAPFMGADIALLYWAFRASQTAARAREHITLTTSRLSVARFDSRGSAGVTILNPYWVTVILADPEDMPRALLLRTHGKAVQVGRFLNPLERLSFAQVLRSALRSAKAAKSV